MAASLKAHLQAVEAVQQDRAQVVGTAVDSRNIVEIDCKGRG
jgi:hypothetical protein